MKVNFDLHGSKLPISPDTNVLCRVNDLMPVDISGEFVGIRNLHVVMGITQTAAVLDDFCSKLATCWGSAASFAFAIRSDFTSS